MSTTCPVSREQTQAKLDLRSAAASRHKASQTYCTAERFEEAVQKHGERSCLVYRDECYSYAQANARINQTAHALRGLGVRCGDVVALCLENRPAFIFAWLALSKLGATVAFLNTNVSGKPLAHALAATGATRAIVGEECLANFAATEGLAGVEQWLWPDAERPADAAARAACSQDLLALADAAPVADPPVVWRAGLVAEKPAIYIFTSGTTGLPKAAIISHARWLVTGDVMQLSMGIKPDDRFYCFLPLYHGAASLSAGATAMAAGASLLLRRKFSRREFWSDVRTKSVTVCQYVGEICRFLLAEPPSPDDRAHRMRKMVGAGLSVEIWEKFVARFGEMEIFEGWGATEANASTINLDNRVGSCGRVPFWEKTNLRFVRYDVDTDSHPRDANGFMIPCESGEVGEAIGMILNIPDVMAGRFEGYTSAQATEQKIRRNVFRQGDAYWFSGDLLRCDDDGYCWFVDRLGDTFRWKSENVSTLEVADALADLPGLETITVYGVQVPGHEGRAGMAAVVMRDRSGFDPQAFWSLTEKRLPKYAAPLFVRVAAQSDMTSTYKLRKVDLQREGFDTTQVQDPLFVRDAGSQTYVPLTAANLASALAG